MKAELRRQTGGRSDILLALSGLAVVLLCALSVPAEEPVTRESAIIAPQRLPQYAAGPAAPSPRAEAGDWRAVSAGPVAPPNDSRSITWSPLRTREMPGPRLDQPRQGPEVGPAVSASVASAAHWLPESDARKVQPARFETTRWTSGLSLSGLSIGFESDSTARRLTDSPSAGTADADVVRDVPELSLRHDWHCLRSDIWQDFDSLWTRDNVLVLLAAGGASLAVHETLDDDVADNTGRHPHRWGDIQNVVGGIGNPPHHLAAIAGLYAYSLHYQDVEVHELSKSLFNAVALTGGATVLLKVASGTGTHAPNNELDSFGGSWPSGHTSSSFAFASVLDEYYGPKVGIPAYILAGLVGWERIDDREHDLSDVVFGAALGYVIGKTVAREHHERFYGMEVQPYIDPVTGTSGVAFERRF